MRKRSNLGSKLFSIILAVALVIGMIPGIPAQTVSAAAATDPIYAAAYAGTQAVSDTTLPSTIEIDSQSVAVNWQIGEDTFAVPYNTVTVMGTIAGGTSVTAHVEVIPPQSNPLVYFVDSGRGGDSVQGNGPTASPFYEAVKTLSEDTLLNKLPDQRYNGTNSWGFDATQHGVKNSKDGGHTDPATDPSKWIVGLRAANDHIIYKLSALEPGTYTLSSGFHDWYGNRSRTMRPQLQYQDLSGETQMILLDQFNTNTTTFISSEFTIPADIDTSEAMTLTYAYVSDEKPILSWFAIAEGGIKGLIEDARQEAASIVNVLLDGNDIKADNVNGLTFKGFGVLSANSTSALLMDYKSEQPEVYAQMLQILFGGDYPLMTHVKIEMGNDRNNSTGPDPATMRTENEEANVTRHPGFQLAADAKAVNPDLKVSILRWSAPKWADGNNDKIYTWYKNTILAAYREYGYMVDYVNPHINEHAPDLTWTKQYAARVKADHEGFESTAEQELYNKIQAVISDEVGIGSFGGSMVSDAALREAAPIAAYHYNTNDDGAGHFKRLATEFDIEVWNSEAQATFSNSAFRPNNNTQDPTAAGTGIGGTGSALEMGNTIIKGFVNSHRTHFIYQPAIGSFYEGGQYSFKELLSARDPWSGWIHYDAGLVVLQHISWFANIGWENEGNSAGIWRAVPEASYTGATGTNPVSGRNGTPSYMTLAAPDKSDFSTVIVNDSEYARTYKLQTVNMGYEGTPELEAWETRAADEGEAFNSNYMQYLGQITADGSGTYTIKVKPYSIVTVSTLDNKDNETHNTPLPVEGERTVLDTDSSGKEHDTTDNVLYADDFDYTGEVVPVIGANGEIIGVQSYIESRGGTQSVIPRYTHDRNGAFEAYLDEQTGNYVLRQQLDSSIMGLGGTWNGGDPVTAIGDNRWTNYKASVDVSFENNSTQGSANYAAIGARYQGGGSSHSISGTPYVLKYWFDGGWQLLVNNSSVANGNVATGAGGVAIPDFDTAHDAWHNLAIEVAGNKITAYIDDVKLAAYTDPDPKLSGRVDLASGYYHVRFDNLLVEKVEGFTPYYAELLDDLEMHDLAPQPAVKLIYNELWNQRNGQGMFHYQRSLSTSKGAGAELTYTFTGTGLDLLGPNDGSAKLEVIVDGEVLIPSAATIASRELYQTFALRGLEYGEHTVQIKVLSGTLVVDAVAVVTGEGSGMADTAALQAAVDEAGLIEQGEEFTEGAWQMFVAARAAAVTALDDAVAYRLDQEGAAQLTARLLDAQNQLFMGDIQELSTPHYIATYVGEPPNLPEKVEATLEDGTTIDVAVKWNVQDVSFDTPYETVAVSGSFGSLSTVAYIEVVPKDIVYFVDLNGTAAGSLGYHSPAYESVAALAADYGKPLLNDKADQKYDAAIGWGHDGHNASGATSINYKGIVAGAYSKQSTTGLYTSDQIGAKLSYTFANLPAGEYTLTLGSYSWWASNARTAEVSLVHDGDSELVDTITLDSSSYSLVKSYPVTLEEAGTLTLELKAQNNQSPMLSFVGVAPVQSEEPEEPEEPELKLPTSYETVVVATYVGEEPNLPTTISGKAADNSTVNNIFVEWNEQDAANFSVAFADTIEVTGTAYLQADGSGDRVELDQPATAYVEVVPTQLKYFIDAGTTNPYIYDAISALIGEDLLNDATNEVYNAAAGWGYIALGSDGAVKPIINKSAQSDLDKHATGIMIDGGDPLSTLSYQLDGLEGGKSYRFTSYHRLWWGNEMPFKIAISYLLNGEQVTQNINRLHLDHADHSEQVSYSVNLPEGATEVKYVMTNVGSYTAGPGANKTNKNPAISWLAVEELDAPAVAATYDAIGGVAGKNTEIWLDNNGVPIQAHGGQVQWVEHVTWDGDTPSYVENPGAGDGAWLWVGEDKTYGGRPIGGIHTYVSKDLYNWVDMGIALYPHRVFPMEKGDDGQGVQLSQDQLTSLKMRAMATAGAGVNELGETLSQFDIDYARDFLQAYVDKATHPNYSRANDASFDYVGASYDEASLLLAFDRTYAYYTIMERPKMLYNDATDQYVIVYHVDGPTDARILEHFDTLENDPMYNTGISRYSRAQMGFAVSDSPFGPFKLVNAQKMNYIEGYYPNNEGMARDMTVFKDDDGKAYAIYSSEENKYTYISLLNDMYTAPAKDGTEGLGETFTARVFTDVSREAPAIFKYNGYYYFITSGTTGWDPNPSIVYRANHIFGNTTDDGESFTPYTKLGNPFPNDSSNTSYRTQSTAVIPYDPENGKFIYMGDRWIQRALETSGYVWLPLQISANGTKVEGLPLSDWNLSMLDTIAPVKLLSANEITIGLGEAPQLPELLDVQKGSTIYTDIPVVWDQASLAQAALTLGKSLVQGTLGGELAGIKVDYEITVTLPDNMLYFVNPASGEVAHYQQLISDYKATTGNSLRHDVAEQNYDPQNGKTWGYVGNNSKLRDNTVDIYQSLRYVTSSTDRSLTYKFELEQGSYNVYIGYFDPWYSSSQGKRSANTTINGVTVETGRIISGSYEIAGHNDIALTEDGVLEVVVSPGNTGNNTDIQLSWIIVSKVEESEEPEEPSKEALQALYDEHKDKQNDNYTEESWNGLQHALAGALSVLEDEAATQEKIDEALQSLSAALEALEPKTPDPEPEPEDSVKPIITLLGEAVVQVNNGAAYNDAGATAIDDKDGDISEQIMVTITRAGESITELDTTVAGTYTYHYNVSDAAGNAADEVTRTVIVRAKQTTPTTPPPTTPEPTPPAVPESTQQLSKDDFKQDADGKLVVNITDGKDTVLLPNNWTELVGDQTLQLVQQQMSIELSKEALQQLQQALEKQQTSGSGIAIQLLASDEAREQAVQGIADQTKATAGIQLTLASEVAQLDFSLVTASGTSVPLTTLTEPIMLSFKVSPETNAELLGVYAIAEDGTLQYIGGKLVDGMMNVQVDQPGQYVVLEYNKQFADVNETYWANNVIKALTAKHIVTGVSDELFVPAGNVTRAEFTALITRVLGLRDSGTGELGFADVAADAWYAEAVAAASKAGIIQGRSAEQFDPNAAVTRQEMAVLIMRAYQFANGGQANASDMPLFSDYEQISGWAQEAVQTAQTLGIINGHSDGRFAPQHMMTRAESAQIVYNLLQHLQ